MVLFKLLQHRHIFLKKLVCDSHEKQEKTSNRDVNLTQQLRLDCLKSQWLTHKVINYKWSVVIIEELCFKVLKMNANISKMKIKVMKCRKEMDFICHFLAVTPSD